MVINTESERVVQSRKIAMELLMSAHDGDCVAPCQLNCPARTDCQGYVGLIANGEYDSAIKLIKNKIPLPASIGRVCPHPCEKACRRKNVEEPINIAQLKAFAADIDLNKESYLPDVMVRTGKKVAIIGGGPAGLTAAYYLNIMGHSVTVYDMMDKMGGMLRYGIPQYRLPKEVLDKEIAIIEKSGVKLVNNVKLGKDFTIQSLKAENDAVIVAVGAWKSSSMRTPGEDLEGVYGGIDFLRAVIQGNAPAIGEKVAICGGGNTAMDACRTAVRLGAKEVYVIYRRTRNEMPADALEIDEAEEEGVIYKFLTNPISFNGENGKLKSVTLQIMELGEPDASGRRRPVPVEGKTEEIPLDSVILAIGQKLVQGDVSELQLNDRGNIEADPDFFTTNIDGVFAIGDATNRGASIAIEAIGEADRCAKAVDAYLNGQALDTRVPYISKREETTIDYSDREKQARLNPKVLDPEVRNKNFDEVSLGFTEEEAQAEASRCLECGCREYYKCKLLNVARASIGELREDYEDYLKGHHLELWSNHHPRFDAMLAFCRENNDFGAFASMAEKLSDEEFCNMAITVCRMTDKMLVSYLDYLEKRFVTEGGIKERMHAARTGYRQEQDARLQYLEEENKRLKAILNDHGIKF